MSLSVLNYYNYLSSENMIEASSNKTGRVSGAQKTGTGSATINTSGYFSGSGDKEFTVIIDSVASGTEIGQATFKWSNSGAYTEGVATGSSNILLSDGVYVSWNAGTGADFVIGDTWYFKAFGFWTPAKLIDLDRDTSYRSNSLDSPNYFTINLGGLAEVKSLIFYDHNFTSDATIYLKANTTATGTWSNPTYSGTVNYNADKICHYLPTPQTYQYWRIEITDTGNTDGYIEMSELYLGTYFQFANSYAYGFSTDRKALFSKNTTAYGALKRRFYNTIWKIKYTFPNISDAELINVNLLTEVIGNKDDGTFNFVYWGDNMDIPNNIELVSFDKISVTKVFDNMHKFTVSFTEVLRSL